MTYCCECIKTANELIVKAGNVLNWRSDLGVGDGILGGLTLGIWSTARAASNVDEATSKMKNAYNILVNAQKAIDLCDCGSERDFYKNRQDELVRDYNNLSSNSTNKFSNLKDRFDDLARNSVSKDKAEELVKRYEEVWEEYKKNIEDYNRLARNSVSKDSYEEMKRQWKKDVDDYNKLVGEHKELAERCRNLVRRLEEYEEYKERFEDTRDERERERIANTEKIATLQQENLGLKGQLTRTQQRLTASENKVLRIEERLETRNREVIELKNKLSNLSINVNNLEKSREELLNEKVNLKNDKLETFANNSGIGLNEVNNLLRYYERLINARKNYNPINIETHEGNINRVKEGLRQNGVNVGDTQKCCRKCEKVAKLRIELNEIRQQQFEARQEVPSRQ